MATDGYSSRKERDYVWAIVRYDASMPEPETQFTITEVVFDDDIAEAEVARLNALAAGRGYRYFLHGTRLYPRGSSAGTRRPPPNQISSSDV
ncbi:MAG TPA: hypothetical protein VFK04_05035 [Gemmatimonadaceae bacterium]|nr:hypothetical protein [Gemmatimonadaceae bacterium]